MNKRAAQYLAHPENRIHICQVNALLWDAKGDVKNNAWMAQNARKCLLDWISIAQENNEQHF